VTPKQPTASPKDVVRVAEKLGFIFRRQSGSHAIYVRQSDHVSVVIPMHKGELKRKTLRGIIQDLKITVEDSPVCSNSDIADDHFWNAYLGSRLVGIWRKISIGQ
jgi:predicted RNA binding protein YcfA (HicA-like mRNA interferase family)